MCYAIHGQVRTLRQYVGCITCDINKFINLDVLEKIILVLNAFKKNLQHKSLLLPILSGHGQGW